MRVVPQAENCKELQVGDRVYRRSTGGLFDLPDRAARAAIAQGCGQLPALSGTTRTGEGFRCEDCGFGCWFTTCSRCGGNAVRELQVA